MPVAYYEKALDPHSHGTTGVVALDRNGNIAAGTPRADCRARCRGAWAIRRSSARDVCVESVCAVRPRARASTSSGLGVAREICNLVLLQGHADPAGRGRSDPSRTGGAARHGGVIVDDTRRPDWPSASIRQECFARGSPRAENWKCISTRMRSNAVKARSRIVFAMPTVLLERGFRFFFYSKRARLASRPISTLKR